MCHTVPLSSQLPNICSVEHTHTHKKRNARNVQVFSHIILFINMCQHCTQAGRNTCLTIPSKDRLTIQPHNTAFPQQGHVKWAHPFLSVWVLKNRAGFHFDGINRWRDSKNVLCSRLPFMQITLLHSLLGS